MDEKTLYTLEYPKILQRLVDLCDFGASRELALDLSPTDDITEARRLLGETGEAYQMLVTHTGTSIGGARDVRPYVDLAEHGGTLDTPELLDIKYTLIAARNLVRTFDRLEGEFQNLVDVINQLPIPAGVIDRISRAISDHGDILDTASDRLGHIRHDMRIAHDRLLSRMERMVSDPKIAPYLQEALVTQRDGRYVLPLRAEFKGKVKSIVHDQSASGATLFIEPLTVVEQNNKYRELQLEERDEERRILSELSTLVASFGFEIIKTVEIIAIFDLALARAKLALSMEASELTLREIKPQGKQHPGTLIRLYNARHPLLDPDSVVAIDVELDPQTYALVITGPNTGGKTVTLKTVGLLALMAQSGMFVPAQAGSELSCFQDIFADIGDEQSIEQSLSTFSSHITNIIRILEAANSKSLVILDELGAGTDPQEGAALARALLSHVLERRIMTLVTTHHPELKAYAHAKPGLTNASVEFDLETLSPTFHLTIGLPGRSNALAIAQRLGLPGAIVEDAKSELRPEDLQTEDLLDEIHRQRDLSRHARTQAELYLHETEKLRAELVERLDRIEDERRETLEDARLESQAQVRDIQSQISKVRRDLIRARQPLEVLHDINEQIEEIEEIVETPVEREISPVHIPRRRTIRLGDKVRLRTLGTKGVVTALSEEEAEVQVGMMRVRTRLVDLEIPSEEPESSIVNELKPTLDEAPAVPDSGLPDSPGIELDIRGHRADDARDSLERYLEKAYLAVLPYVRIIHGKGTGRLRSVVREFLTGHPYVRSFEAGGDKEGGEGVTVAKLNTS
jgi:DNA mismatch repair protein MutS2